MANFYGPYEIDTMEEVAGGTNLTFKEHTNAHGVKVTPVPLFVPEVLTDVITDEATDYNEWYEKRLTPVVDEVLALFAKYNVFIGAGEGIASDISYVFDRVIQYIKSGRNKVDEHYWGAPEHAKTMKQLLDHLKNA
jgi:hypothetical protein